MIRMLAIDTALIREIIRNGRRIDGRKFDEYRDVVIEPGIIELAEGSARVMIGNTKIVAGVKLDTGEPFSDTPNEGLLMVAAEFVPLASSEFEPGPPGEESIELARVVDRAIRESKAIDLKKLCIRPGELVWSIFIDIDVLDHDGNLIDAASLAAIAALLNTKMLKLDKEMQKPLYEEKTDKPLPISKIPINTTFVKIADNILADPIIQEEESADARLTIGTFEDGICSMQKGGSEGLSMDEIEQIIEMAKKKGDELRKLVKEKIMK